MPLALAWTAMVNEMPRRPRSFKVAFDCYGRVKGDGDLPIGFHLPGSWDKCFKQSAWCPVGS
jgi:hypothetical protein